MNDPIANAVSGEPGPAHDRDAAVVRLVAGMARSCTGVALVVLIATLCADAAAQNAESLVDPARFRGLAADHRAQRVGDIVTVLVLEATRARSRAATDAASGLELSAGFVSPSTDFDAALETSGSNTSGAETTRVGELRTQISTRVIDVEADGMLRIAGEQTLTVNGERQHIRLSGLVRPVDIDASNTVMSNRIAEADLELVGVGVVSESQRQSILYRLFKRLGLL